MSAFQKKYVAAKIRSARLANKLLTQLMRRAQWWSAKHYGKTNKMPIAPTSFRKRRDKIFEVVGFLVVAMQGTEGVINAALQLALPEDDAVTLESLTKDQERFRKATLGRLIKAIKERSNISPDFDQVLEAYLTDRNTLIHDLSRMGGFDYKSKEGLERMGRFVENLNQNYEVVTKVFMSLLWEWADQVGMNEGMDRERIKRTLGELDGIAEHVFFSKA